MTSWFHSCIVSSALTAPSAVSTDCRRVAAGISQVLQKLNSFGRRLSAIEDALASLKEGEGRRSDVRRLRSLQDLKSLETELASKPTLRAAWVSCRIEIIDIFGKVCCMCSKVAGVRNGSMLICLPYVR